MPRVLKTAPAEADLEGIYEYIVAENPLAADRLLDDMEARLQLLSEHPFAGRARPELRQGLRSSPVGRYVMFYRVLENHDIELVRVLHGARDIDLPRYELIRG